MSKHEREKSVDECCYGTMMAPWRSEQWMSKENGRGNKLKREICTQAEEEEEKEKNWLTLLLMGFFGILHVPNVDVCMQTIGFLFIVHHTFHELGIISTQRRSWRRENQETIFHIYILASICVCEKPSNSLLLPLFVDFFHYSLLNKYRVSHKFGFMNSNNGFMLLCQETRNLSWARK